MEMPVTVNDHSLCTDCGTDPFSQSLHESVRTLFACTNCRADIVGNGGASRSNRCNEDPHNYRDANNADVNVKLPLTPTLIPTAQGWMTLMRLAGMYSLRAVRQEWLRQSKPARDTAEKAALNKILEDPGYF